MDCCSHQKIKQTDCSSHGSHGMGHGDASMYLKRFWIVTVLLVPLVLTNPAIAEFFHIPTLELGKWIQFIIATVVFGFSLVFFQHAWHEIKAREYGMMTLVSLAVGAGYIFSVVATFLPAIGVQFYLEISTLIWVLLFGHYLEAKSGAAAGDALSEVAKLLPKQVHVLKGDEEVNVDISSLKEKDVVLVKPGEKVPADGTVISGNSSVDESLVSGESRPVPKEKGSMVVAGSIALDGSLTIRLSRVGSNSTVGQIQALIESAQMTKPRQARIADTASAILTFVALVVAVITLLVWTLVLDQTFVFAVTLAITVLVIACPHALGLAIPTVTTITTSLAVKNGFFIKDLSKIETIRKTDYVIFDKTGTLTEGKFGVTNVVALDGTKEDVLRIAASLEQHSSHVIGQSILKYAESQGVTTLQINDFQNVAGQGVKAKIDGKLYLVGNKKLIKTQNLPDAKGTIVLVATEDKLLGYITLSDVLKGTSLEAINTLHAMGVKVAMLTGDSKQVAVEVSEALNIDTYFAEVLPEDKYKYVKELQEKGNIVLMVGDGVNDAPALAQANAGIAIGAGTDVAVESGDVVLTDNDPKDIARLISLSKKVYNKMIQNLVWALGYNIVAIPAAAGVFAIWGFFLRPEVGALVMSLSTVIVVVNALSLKRINL